MREREKVDKGPLARGSSVSGTIGIDSRMIQYSGVISQKGEYGAYVLLLMHREVREREANPYQHSEIPLNGLGRSSLMKKLERHLYSKYHEQFSMLTASETQRRVEKQRAAEERAERVARNYGRDKNI